MKKIITTVLKILRNILIVLLALILIGIIYGWIARGLFITTEDVEYAYPEDHPVSLPADHAAHPDFKTEWWYYTGHLTDDSGRGYGFELVFFRIRSLGVWENHIPVWWFFKTHVTVAQFAVLDKSTGEHTAGTVHAQNSQSDVGADTDRPNVWAYDWRATGSENPQGRFDMHITADNGRYAMDLDLVPEKPVVLHGENGLLNKQPYGVNSNYISFTRLRAEGTLAVDGQTRKVTGQAWHDHEYASAAPNERTAGWDWLSIQFDKTAEPLDPAFFLCEKPSYNPLDGAELMLYQVRALDNTPLEGSKGTFVDRDGVPQSLVQGRDFTIETGTEGVWTSPASGAPYPLGWHIELPERKWTIDVSPIAMEQEVLGPKIGVNYWEGACTVTAATPEGAVQGVAYVELCGYDKRVDKF